MGRLEAGETPADGLEFVVHYRRYADDPDEGPDFRFRCRLLETKVQLAPLSGQAFLIKVDKPVVYQGCLFESAAVLEPNEWYRIGTTEFGLAHGADYSGIEAYTLYPSWISPHDSYSERLREAVAAGTALRRY